MLGCRPKLEKVTAGVSVCVGVVSVIENGLRPDRENPVRDSFNPGILTQHRTHSAVDHLIRSEEHTSELQSLMRISYAVFCLKKKKATRRCHAHQTTRQQRRTNKHKSKKKAQRKTTNRTRL